ncbi:MAG: putative spermidine/putrescine transport system permease protein [Microbacteriaceae bacterium]|jgi:putative spermidine/putrescine transport system permease protein|nr:transporter permease subunit [Microbacteriaceae bacterium]MDQ1526924.1 putative spermidine/putrescine transport system permease protein [Microbacteriaceae bacterium]
MSGATRAGKVTSNAVQIGTEPSKAARRVILGVVGGVFAIPIVAMILFTLKNSIGGGYTFSHWTGLFDPAQSSKYQQLFIAVGNSLQLAVVTVAIILVILVPTMILVHLQFPKLRRVLEFICIVPVTVPAIVLVVGLAPVYAVVVRTFGSSIWTLAFAYGITVLPYAYRAIQANLSAVDVITLSEAARSLGAGWGSVMWRILLPNLRRGILAASFITVAVVLGEFTIASLLGRNNLQTALVQVSKVDPFVAVIFALIALFFAFVLLLLIGRLGSAGRNRKAL